MVAVSLRAAGAAASAYVRRPGQRLPCLFRRAFSDDDDADAPPPPARVALAQVRSTMNKTENMAAVSKCAALASAGGASFLCLPECFAFMGQSAKETVEEAEDIFPSRAPDGAPRTGIIDTLRSFAVEHNLWISAGGMHERTTCGEEKVFNTHFVLRPDGSLAGLYRKANLYDVSIPHRGIDLRESATTVPGSLGTVLVRDTPLGTVGLTTSYDVRFPEMYSALADAGADCVLVPSAFTVPTGAAHWSVLLRARAAEGQCYVFAAAQVGVHGPRRRSYGHSMAVDPWGEVAADAGGYGGLQRVGRGMVAEGAGCAGNEHDEPVPTPSVVFCDVDREMIGTVRERIPIAKQRAASQVRYGLPTDGLQEE